MDKPRAVATIWEMHECTETDKLFILAHNEVGDATFRLCEVIELGYLLGLLDEGELDGDTLGEELGPLVGDEVPAVGGRLAKRSERLKLGDLLGRANP